MKTTDFIECEESDAVITASCWYHIKARNGQIMLTSETYDSKSNCKRAAAKFGKKYGIPVRVAWEGKR